MKKARAQGTSPVVVALAVDNRNDYAVQGRATFRTPFGMRKVRFEQEGAMMFGERPRSSP